MELTLLDVCLIYTGRYQIGGTIAERKMRRDIINQITEQCKAEIEASEMVLRADGFKAQNLLAQVELELDALSIGVIAAMIASVSWPAELQGKIEDSLLGLGDKMESWRESAEAQEVYDALPESVKKQLEKAK